MLLYHSVKMSEAITEPKAYTRLTDNIVSQILSNTKPELSVVCLKLYYSILAAEHLIFSSGKRFTSTN